MDRDESRQRQPVVLASGEGRSYDMGRIRAVFKADGAEAAGGYSISEWWLEPNTTGPGAHAHSEDDVFYVIEGTMSVLVGDRWIDAPKGSFVLVPGGVTHDFENRSPYRAGVLNLSHPGEFEQHMSDIVAWVRRQSPRRRPSLNIATRASRKVGGWQCAAAHRLLAAGAADVTAG